MENCRYSMSLSITSNIFKNSFKSILDENTKKRLIIYFDLLGFKGMIERKTERRISEILITVEERIKELKNIEKIFPDGTKETLNNIINTLYISDSYFIIVDTNDKDDVTCILDCFAKILHNIILVDKIPLKGAIAYGEITLIKDRNIMFGEPVNKAVQLENKTKHIGITIDNSIKELFNFNKYNNVLYFRHHNFFILPIDDNELNLFPFFEKIHTFSGCGVENCKQILINNIILKKGGQIYLENTISLLDKYEKLIKIITN